MDYENWDVIQKGKGKGDYIRVTNIRGKKAAGILYNSDIFDDYLYVVQEFLKIGRSRTVEIQRIPNLLIYKLYQDGYKYSVADFDDGLMYVGTSYCYNHDEPRCENCPLNDMCWGKEDLIKKYRT